MTQNLEIPLGNSIEENIKLAEILKETDQMIEENKNSNNDLR